MTAVFAPRARRELLEAADRISRDNADAADALLTGARRTADMVARRPGIARPRPDLAAARYRFFALSGFPYLMVFDTEATPVRVVRVVHQSRDLPSVLVDLDGA